MDNDDDNESDADDNAMAINHQAKNQLYEMLRQWTRERCVAADENERQFKRHEINNMKITINNL